MTGSSIKRHGVDPRIAGGRLTIDLDAVAANYRTMVEKSGRATCAAVVKADAYGLGAERIVPTLAEQGCDTFFVAFADEGIAVRKMAPRATIYVLNGIHEQSVATVAEAGLFPVLCSLEQIDLWANYWKAHGSRRPCALQVDTGMNRLGLTLDEALAFRERNMAEHLVTPILVMSHLACADDPVHPKNSQQLDSFQRVATAFGDVDSSLANSAATLTGGDLLFDVTRPGIALYGGEALNDTPNPMQVVATLEARIAQIRHAKKGETVSYGATQTLERDTKIAITSVGYADGYPRAGSARGTPLRDALEAGAYGFVADRKVPLLGRVTMDLCMFDVTDVSDEALSTGWIELFGKNIALDTAARAAGTIGYELLTSLGNRYERQYHGSSSIG